MNQGDPRHERHATTTVRFDRHGEPKQVIAAVDYFVHIPEYGPDFELADSVRDRLGDKQAEFVRDWLYDQAYARVDPLTVDDIKDRLEDDGYIQVDHKQISYQLREDEFSWEINELEGEFKDGIDAEFVFDVDDAEASLDYIQNVDGITQEDHQVSVKVLRLWDAAAQATAAVPGVESVESVRERVQSLIEEGQDAVWGR